jgi:hypothetical protein
MARWKPDAGRPQPEVLEAPTYRPTKEQWKDPFAFIMSVYPEASRYGMCKVVPPEGWAPPFALERGTNGANADSFRFAARRQFTSHLCMRAATSVAEEGGASRWGGAEEGALGAQLGCAGRRLMPALLMLFPTSIWRAIGDHSSFCIWSFYCCFSHTQHGPSTLSPSP